jgi:hypothetical protein
MNELDENWSAMLNFAMQKAAADGRSDVADYLRLKTENDLVRDAGVRWLFDSMIAIAMTRENVEKGVTAERVEPHSFPHGPSNISGSMLKISHGVRCLTAEAGWTRTPSDGFMRGGALAIGRLTHFGMPKGNCEIMLVRGSDGTFWKEVETLTRVTRILDSAALIRHFDLFLGRSSEN